MRIKTIIFCVAVPWLFCLSAPALGSDDAASGNNDSDTGMLKGYALVMANGTTIKVSEYTIDPEKKTVFFKSRLSGLAATFPLERIKRVVMYNRKLNEVPDDAQPLYIPEKTAQMQDDEGIPVVFKVQKTVVGSGGGSSGYSRAGGSRSSDYRSNYRSGSSSSRSRGSVSSGRTSSGRTVGGAGASSSPSGGSTSADNFFDALFGGKR